MNIHDATEQAYKNGYEQGLKDAGMNKYGGINDMPHCEKRIYGLWYQMLRRCYDTTQHNRPQGRAYADCEVCSRWKRLSCFAKDVKKLDGYSEWCNKKGYCLDKDTKKPGNKVYSKDTCSFIPCKDNIRDVSRRHPGITKKANEANKVMYSLEKDGETLIFTSEKEACVFLGVKQCSVASCYLKGYKCKGYKIAKMDLPEPYNPDIPRDQWEDKSRFD